MSTEAAHAVVAFLELACARIGEVGDLSKRAAAAMEELRRHDSTMNIPPQLEVILDLSAALLAQREETGDLQSAVIRAREDVSEARNTRDSALESLKRRDAELTRVRADHTTARRSKSITEEMESRARRIPCVSHLHAHQREYVNALARAYLLAPPNTMEEIDLERLHRRVCDQFEVEELHHIEAMEEITREDGFAIGDEDAVPGPEPVIVDTTVTIDAPALEAALTPAEPERAETPDDLDIPF